MVVLNAADHPVALVLWGHLRCVQFIHLEKLQLEGENAALGIPLRKKDTAVHLFPADGHAEHLVQALGAGHIAVALLAPCFPELFDFAIQFFTRCIGLKDEALAHYIADEWAN